MPPWKHGGGGEALFKSPSPHHCCLFYWTIWDDAHTCTLNDIFLVFNMFVLNNNIWHRTDKAFPVFSTSYLYSDLQYIHNMHAKPLLRHFCGIVLCEKISVRAAVNHSVAARANRSSMLKPTPWKPSEVTRNASVPSPGGCVWTNLNGCLSYFCSDHLWVLKITCLGKRENIFRVVWHGRDVLHHWLESNASVCSIALIHQYL